MNHSLTESSKSKLSFKLQNQCLFLEILGSTDDQKKKKENTATVLSLSGINM